MIIVEVSGVGRTGLLAAITRGELFAGLCVLGFANGIFGWVRATIVEDGVAAAVFGTFGISILAWVAFVACPALLLRAPQEPPARADIAMAGFAAVAFMVPVGTLSWVALTSLALYILCDRTAPRTPNPLPFMQRGAWILLATTVAMFWAPWLVAAVGGPILRLEAVLAGWVSGLPRVGNTVRFADGTGYLWIEPACSSLNNVSVVLLCWTLFAQSRGLRWSFGSIGWCLLACFAAIGINAARIGTMALYPEYTDLTHGRGSWGTEVANWGTIAAAVGICALGTQHRHVLRP